MIQYRLCLVATMWIVFVPSTSRGDFLWNAGSDMAAAERDSAGNNRATEANFQNQIVPVWSYGTAASRLGANFAGASPGGHVNNYVNGFFTPNTFDGFLTGADSSILVNYTDTPSSHFQGAIAPKEIFLHPSQANSIFSVIRFTAPTTGTYRLTNYWRHLNTANPGDGGSGHVVHNGVLLDTRSWTQGDGSQHTFTADSLSWNAGDVIDFIIDAGAANDYNSDSTAFNATITLNAVPEPSSMLLLLTSASVGGLLQRHRRRLHPRARLDGN